MREIMNNVKNKSLRSEKWIKMSVKVEEGEGSRRTEKDARLDPNHVISPLLSLCLIQGVQEKLCFFQNSLQPLPRLHCC